MKYFDLANINIEDNTLFSDNLPVVEQDEILSIYRTRIEAQKWCIGIESNLVYNTVVKGIVVPNVQAYTDGSSSSIVQPNYQGKENWIHIALREMGVKEIKGDSGSNSRINEYLKTVGIGPDDDIPWCSAFANWVMIQAGYRGSHGAKLGPGWARSWLDWGRPAAPGTIGSIVVFSRGSYPKGHVGFCVGFDGKTIKLLGGNQSNSVNIQNWKLDNVLGWRLP